LPVKLASYNLKIINENARQINNSWVTATEINTSHFNIQRSVDGINFETAGKMNAKGSSEYSFNDIIPTNYYLLNSIYYKLEIVDNDGSKQYSDIKAVNFKPPNSKLLAYPNPATNNITVTFIVPSKQHIGIKIFNSLGLCVSDLKNELYNEGTYSKTINLSGFSSGNYVLKTNYETGTNNILPFTKF
jgi:hypothetical protein